MERRQHELATSASPYEEALQRIRAEYVEMPAIRLTPKQLQRLSGVNESVCKVVLDDLVRAKFLRKDADGRYVRSVRDRRMGA